MDFKRVPLPADVADETRRVGLAVIGGTLFCTSQTCSHMEMEFRTRCVQAVSLDRLESLYPDYPDLRLLIVDEDLADDLLERADAYRALNRTAMIALGYRDVEIARHHYGRTREAGGAPIGYLSMNAPMEVLLSSMRMLFHGEYFLPQGLLGIAPPGTPAPDTAAPPPPAATGAETCEKLSRLTGREKEILELVSSGNSNKQIARQLGITEHTVKLHMHNMFGKFGVSNRTAAANMYFAAQSQNALR